jgi:ParB-like nuclease domain
MSTESNRSAKADNRRADIEQVLKSHGVKFEYKAMVPLAEIERHRESQSRNRAADPKLVNEYKEKMARGAVFPPIVVWMDGYQGYGTVDGNTRVEARRKRGESHIDAYIIEVADNNEAIYISAIFNATHGQKLTKDEIRKAVIAARLTTNPPTAERLAQDYGLPVGTVSRIQNVHRIDEELAAINLDPSLITESARYALSRFGDTAVKESLFGLVAESQMPQNEIRALCKDVQGKGSEMERLQVIADARAERQPQIAAVSAGRAVRKIPSLAMPLGQLIALANSNPDPTMLVPADPAKRAEQALKVFVVADYMKRLAEAFRDAERTEQVA